MKIALWILLLPVHILVILARYPLAPVAVLLFSTKDKRHLRFMRWLETLDNDLTGDNGWRTEHIKGDPRAFWNRVGWLWRNGGNAVNYGFLGVPDKFSVYHLKPWLWRNTAGHWMIRNAFKLGPRYLEIFWGWSLLGAKHGRCKFTFTTRLKKRL